MGKLETKIAPQIYLVTKKVFKIGKTGKRYMVRPIAKNILKEKS